MKRSKEEIKHIILGQLNDFDNTAVTNPCYNSEIFERKFQCNFQTDETGTHKKNHIKILNT